MLKRLRSWLFLDEARWPDGLPDEEIAEELQPTKQYDILEAKGGVKIRPAEITEGTSLTVWYSGDLAQRDPEALYMHYGFGTDEWEDIGEVEMYKDGDNQWMTNVYVNRGQAISFCFKDGAGNWDNNHGRNWTFQVH
ncbi:MAG TPA: hypothetical protein GXX57_01255 [Firmicutes bacterium]|nr:hypothetical protein [Bacillota bacterium]